ncbi:hypothetical protein QUF99_00515 [Bacillus sp. DX4.1]|uniref:hypothetical protein n=1 Tax=Bacillus sp. DX4.1 TaxID=3055867 RepID=UPI0025A0B5E9|nr:hypothetical protein [Bacillus sp. DX4.1]MDM5185980.1 hypothetical protein [Bacillus sp. DX4.1]
MNYMTSKEIINKFINFFLNVNYSLLSEKKIVRSKKEETYFNMSAIAANIDLFNDLNNEQDINRNFVTKQQVFFSNKLDGVGNTPLANPTEVSLSIFNKQNYSPSLTIKHILEFLGEIGIQKEKLLFRIANNDVIKNAYLSEGITEKQIFIWDKMEVFNIGDNRPKGFYTYPYYKYKNGCVPLGSISFINHNGYWTSDVAIFQERLSLILNNLDKVVEIDAISPLYAYLSEELNFDDEYTMRITLFLRAIAFLVKDGLTDVSSSYQGHFLKKLMREIGALLGKMQFSNQQKTIIFKLLNNCLYYQGYNLEKNEQHIIRIIDNINKYSQNISLSIEQEVKKYRRGQQIDIPYLSQTLGIKPEWLIVDKNVEEQINVEAKKYIKVRNSIRNRALSLDVSKKIDLVELLSEK